MENLTTTKRTTQALLKRLQCYIDNYTPEGRRTASKERVEWHYEVAKHVSETLRLNEILLLYYLRNSPYGYTHYFMRIAKKISDANQELEKIKSTIPTCNKGRREREKNRN